MEDEIIEMYEHNDQTFFWKGLKKVESRFECSDDHRFYIEQAEEQEVPEILEFMKKFLIRAGSVWTAGRILCAI